MTASPTTILIPDISGFTEFMTHTELSHGSFAISMLIDTIIDAVKEEYEISEIEGDAVLMYKRCFEPSQKEIQDSCLKIFNAFHLQRNWLQQHAICPCKACDEIVNLTLKFIAHHGSVGEIKAGGFTKLSGIDVIVAHRLLKNGVPSNEYLLLTEQLLQHAVKAPEDGLEWSSSSDDYPSIGKVDYRFTILNQFREADGERPKPPFDYQKTLTVYSEIPIAANYRDAYMVLMNIPSRPEWLPSLQKVEQPIPAVYLGSIHHCTFDTYEAVVSPIQMTLTPERINYAESCLIEKEGLSLVYEFVFSKMDQDNCLFSWRFLSADQGLMKEEQRIVVAERMQEMAKNLKVHCDHLETSFFV